MTMTAPNPHPTTKIPVVSTPSPTAVELIAGMAKDKVAAAVIQVVNDGVADLRGYMADMSAAKASGDIDALYRSAEKANFEIRHVAATIIGRKDELSAAQYNQLTQLRINLNTEYEQKIKDVGLEPEPIQIAHLAEDKIHEPIKSAFYTFLEVAPVAGPAWSLEEETRYMKGLFEIMEEETKLAIREAFIAAKIDLDTYAERLAMIKILARRDEDLIGVINAKLGDADEPPVVQADLNGNPRNGTPPFGAMPTAPVPTKTAPGAHVPPFGAMPTAPVPTTAAPQLEDIERIEDRISEARRALKKGKNADPAEKANLYEKLGDAQDEMLQLRVRENQEFISKLAPGDERSRRESRITSRSLRSIQALTDDILGNYHTARDELENAFKAAPAPEKAGIEARINAINDKIVRSTPRAPPPPQIRPI